MTTYRATISEVQTVVAEIHAIPREAMKSKCRKQEWARPRQEAMRLARELTGASYPQIAWHFGGKNHTTCIYAVRKITALEATDAKLAARLAECRARIAAVVSRRIGKLVAAAEGAAVECPVLAPRSSVVGFEQLLVAEGHPAAKRMGGLPTRELSGAASCA